jgi:CubicO group peptidase (beta-lactamase class C family)
MKMKGLIVVILIIISTPATVGLNLDFTNDNEILLEKTSNFIDPFEENITYWMDRGHIPGLSACIVINDSIAWEKGYGYANIKKKINATGDTIYLGASISKTITATAIMQLWEKGLIDLDEDVSNHLPFELRNPSFPDKEITFRMLLSHHSSLSGGDWRTGPFIYLFFSLFGDSKERYEDLATPSGAFYNRRIWTDAEPGETLKYSNAGYFILEYLVELISNQPFDEYCTEHIFELLEMYNTSYHISNYNTDEVSAHYIWVLISYITLPNYQVNNFGVGGVRTSVKELSHFLIAHMNDGVYKGKRILEEETIDIIRTIQFPDANQSQWMNYGLGWRVSISNESYSLMHPGIGPGIATYINYNPVENKGVIFFVNQFPLILPYNYWPWVNILLLNEKADSLY